MRAIVVALSVLALLLSGCADDEPPPRQAPDETGVDVIVKALDTMFTWFPGRDRSSQDAYDRAAEFLTPQLADLSDANGDVQPTARWLDWERRQATVKAETFVVEAEHPPDTESQVIREAVITQTVTDPAGAKEALQPLNAHVTAIRTDAGWRVSAIDIR